MKNLPLSAIAEEPSPFPGEIEEMEPWEAEEADEVIDEFDTITSFELDTEAP